MKSYTADICDKYNKNIQVLDPVYKSYGGISMCHGEITTIELDEDNTDLVNLLKNEKGNGKICVVNVKGTYCAVVGETLMGYAYTNGWAGIVINGYVRDTHETAQIPVGLFALGTYPLKSTKKASSKRDIDLIFGNVIIKPNQILYADNDGIVITTLM
jgi:regulator of ribonuclease activity A